MRYIVDEITVNTISDQIISQTDDQLSLLKSIKENNLEMAITIKRKVNYEDRYTTYQKARVSAINDGKINIISIKEKANLIIKDILLSEISQVKVFYDKNSIFYKQNSIERVDLLDFN